MNKIFFFLFLLAIFFFSCKNNEGRKTSNSSSLATSGLKQGKYLSEKYCQTCHLYPDPSLLDKKTWERSVLPTMGRFFGIYEVEVTREHVIMGAIDKTYANSLFPAEVQIKESEWKKIKDFYISLAPDTLPSIDFKEWNFSYIDSFEVRELSDETRNLSVSLVKAVQSDHNLYIGGIKNGQGKLYVFDEKLHPLDNVTLPSAPTDLNITDSNYLVSLIGTLRLESQSNKYGQLFNLIKEKGSNEFSSYQEVAVNLLRPVQLEVKDITGNGFNDLMIAEFGFYKGGLYFYNDINSNVRVNKNTIFSSPGAIKFYLRDMDNDGIDDIIVLFAQGDEHISIFYNQGNGNFKEQRVLEFPPSYGSVYFELVDFDSDGLLDILYCNGDNADYPPILKNYHGVYIFKNKGKDKYEKVFFYPMYGAYKSKAVDFKGNGKFDIIAISMFPDLNDSIRRDLVILKNLKDFNFTPKFLKKSLPARWITFDIKDVNDDGLPDIILGSAGSLINPSNEKLNSDTVPNGIYLLINK